MKQLTAIIILAAAIFSANAGWLPFFSEQQNTEAAAEIEDVTDWWQNGVFYQIYPRSFMDENNDGTGDIKGITSKLQHLKDLGVTGTWLSPIFTSPMIDGGYDIQDYRDVNPMYGTKEDLIALFAKAKELDIKIILDFVPNHCSYLHDWFKLSANRTAGYEDYFTWRDCPIINVETGERRLPNNWIAVFNTPMWTYHEERDQCYMHQFTKEQPDLNYRMENGKIVQEMMDVLTYWMDLGADGFRVDAINHLYESASFTNQQMFDETADPALYDNYNNMYTKDLTESYEFIYDARAHMDAFSKANGNVTRILMTEAYTTIKKQTQWFGTQERPGSHVPFNFVFIADITKDSNASEYKAVVDEWVDSMPSYTMGQANWVLGNHDRPRIASRFGENRHESMTVMSMMLPGIAVVYYGEEIGMTDNYNITWEQTEDPQACQSNRSIYMQYNRDPVRTPMQWDDTAYAGFCESCETWLPLNANAQQINVMKQKDDAKSTLQLYKNLIALRKSKVILQKGSITTAVLGEENDVFAFKRTMSGVNTVAVFVNLGPRKTVSLRDLLHVDDITDKTIVTVLITNNNAVLLKDAVISDIASITLGEYDAVVFEISSAGRLAKQAMLTITIFWIIKMVFA